MTEQSLLDLYATIAAIRLELIEVAGRLAITSDEIHEEAAHSRKMERWCETTAECARKVSHLVVELTRRADLALEDTNPYGLVADLADPEDP